MTNGKCFFLFCPLSTAHYFGAILLPHERADLRAAAANIR
jgi:hypothetical protein